MRIGWGAACGESDAMRSASLETTIQAFRESGYEILDERFAETGDVMIWSMDPVIPRLGLQFSTMLTLAMITEMVFSWPGLGRWLINAIRQQDFAAISAGVMVIGALVIAVNVLSDILGAMANPLKHKEWYALR